MTQSSPRFRIACSWKTGITELPGMPTGASNSLRVTGYCVRPQMRDLVCGGPALPHLRRVPSGHLSCSHFGFHPGGHCWLGWEYGGPDSSQQLGAFSQ